MEAHECRIVVEPAASGSLQVSTDAWPAPEIRLPANSHSSTPLHSAAYTFASQNEKDFSSLRCGFGERADAVKWADSEEEVGGFVVGGCSSVVDEVKENRLQVPQNDTAMAHILHHRSVISFELQGSGCVESVECQGGSSFHEKDPVPATLSDTCSSALDVDFDKGCKASVAEQKMVGMDGGSEKICRVCHLSVEQEPDCKEAMELGCACKNDLALAHRQCAEEWFKVKGNRTCEICGCIVKNVIYRGGTFMVECNNEPTIPVTAPAPPLAPSHGSPLWWFQQPLINFLIACTIVVFLLPWIFRTIMFS